MHLRNNLFFSDCGASEAIGAVMLISVVVLAVAIIGVVLNSQGTPQEIPAFDAVISNTALNGGYQIQIYHNGGDTLQSNQIEILVNGNPQIFKKGGTDAAWTSWAAGESLNASVSSTPQIVRIIYKGANGAKTVLTTADFSAGVYTIGPTGTTTTSTTTTTITTTTTTTTTTATPVPPPVASFNAVPQSGTVPLAVTFTDTSTGSPASWSWVFGDIGTGNISTSQNPSHTYTAAGTYTVKLTATNAGGSSIATKTITANPLQPPIASFTYDPTAGAPPLFVTFTDTSTGGTPTSWNWAFGDSGSGSTSTLQNPTHTYTSAGTYTVTLTAINAGGSTSTSHPIVVNIVPIITDIIPDNAKHNSGWISANIEGSGFQITGTTGVVMVDNATKTYTITGYYVNAPDTNDIFCWFYIPNGANKGYYDVRVTNPDGQMGTLPRGFQVT
jgi:PKD repeat protein